VRALLRGQLVAQRRALVARGGRRALRVPLRRGGGDGALLAARRLGGRLLRLTRALLGHLLGARELCRLGPGLASGLGLGLP